jgi:hypothetical protein
MNKSVTAHSPAIPVGTPPRNLRSLVAVLLVALASLGATIGYIAIDDSGTTTTATIANGQSSPTLDDPFQARTQPVRPLGGPSESAVAAAVGNQVETGSQARYQAYQDKLDSMSAQQKADAFAR